MEYKRGYPMSQMQLFYQTAIRPYLEPFLDLAHHTTGKMITGGVYFIAMFSTFTTELFSAPVLWWKGLAILVVLDFLAGNFKVLTDSRIAFNIKKWGRTAYKIPAYIIAGLSVSIGANMFPEALGWLQYVTFAVLSGMEIWSILNNLRLFALVSILLDVVADRYNINNMDDIKKKVQDQSYKDYQEHEQETFFTQETEPVGK